MMNTLNSQILLRKVLLHYFQKSREINPAYSLRAFSMKLSLAPGSLSQILNGKRKITTKTAHAICHKLELPEKQKEQILRSFRSSVKASPTVSRGLTLEEFAQINHWTYFAILSLIKTADFQPSSEWISDRLGVSCDLAENSLQKLISLGILKWKDGHLERTHQKILTEDDRASSVIREAHKESLQLASASLDNVPIHLRDFTTTTVPMDPKIIPLLKERIRSFYDDIETLIDQSNEKTEVYRLNIELFPLTKTNKKKSL